MSRREGWPELDSFELDFEGLNSPALSTACSPLRKQQGEGDVKPEVD